jgi:hypothetical protein
MAYMTTQVEVDLNEIDLDDLIDEIESRGWTVIDADTVAKNKYKDDQMQEIIWRYNRGYIEDAMILLERSFPELRDISRRIS